MATPPTNSPPIFSIITVCRNAAQTIATTLQSVAQQSNLPTLCEHIVIDGASEDNTVAIIQRFPHVRWISEPDEGISDAFNKGLYLATGTYILYLNGDDYLYDQSVLTDVAQFIDAHNAPDWIVGDVMAAKGNHVTYPQRRYPPSCWSLMLRNRINHQTVFLKRQTLLHLNGFEKRFKIAMDYDLFERLCAHGYQPTYFPRIISVFSEEGVSSVQSPALLNETKEVKTRFRNTPLKRLAGYTYDQIRK